MGFSDGDLATATFSKPKSFAVDLSRNVYVADKGNRAIRKISKSGSISSMHRIEMLFTPITVIIVEFSLFIELSVKDGGVARVIELGYLWLCD